MCLVDDTVQHAAAQQHGSSWQVHGRCNVRETSRLHHSDSCQLLTYCQTQNFKPLCRYLGE